MHHVDYFLSEDTLSKEDITVFFPMDVNSEITGNAFFFSEQYSFSQHSGFESLNGLFVPVVVQIIVNVI